MLPGEVPVWWRGHFEESPIHHAHQIQAQIDGVERFLNLETRARVLDLACGSGRQTLELARRDYRVLGLDSLDVSVKEAQLAARRESLNAHFMKADTRQIRYREEFDAVVSLFASFGRFANERDDLKILESVRKALKPEGKLLLDLVNKEWLMRHFDPNSWERGDNKEGAVVLDQVNFDFETGHLLNHRTIVRKDGRRTSSSVSFRVYTLTEIKRLLEQSGLGYRQCWGGFDGSVYGMDSPRMIVMADKAQEKPVRRRAQDPDRAIRIKGRRR